MPFATFIDFKDGRCRRLRATEDAAIVQEAILACSATQTEANLLDDQLKRVAEVRYAPAALDQYTVIRLQR